MLCTKKKRIQMGGDLWDIFPRKIYFHARRIYFSPVEFTMHGMAVNGT